MAERCELCGARWEIGASTCRDCGSRRRITVPPGDSSASMSGVASPREQLVSTSAPSASHSDASLSGVAPFPPAPSPAAPSPPAPPTAPAPGASPLSDAFTAPMVLPPAVPIAVPPGVSQPLRRTSGRRALVLGLGLGLVGIAVGVTVWLSRPTAERTPAVGAPIEVRPGQRSACEDLAALEGSWVFTTATTGARRKERLGVRGFYQLQITVDGCTATASMAKTGRTDRKSFDDRKVPRAEATLAPGEGIEAYGFAGTFELRNDDGQGGDTRFVLARDGKRLVGHWRQLGERWTSSGLYGVLEGRREGDPVAILPERSRQPCAVRCATPDDIALLDDLDAATHAACLSSCE
jgi:hypothetical protein